MDSMTTVARPDFMRLPSLPLPIYIRSTGRFAMDEGHFHETGNKQTYVQIFWGVAGEGELTIDGVLLRFGPGCVAWKLQEETHSYKALSKSWELRWFTFDGPGADAFMLAYKYPRLLEGAGDCPVSLFQEIERGLRDMSPYMQRKLISVATEIIALAGGGAEGGVRHRELVERFIELAHTNYSNETVNVNSIADILGVHRSTLSRSFKRSMLISPGDYLIRLRLQHALSLLKESSLPVSEVAAKVGIPDRTYFCRCVRRAVGMGPREYRASKT